MGGRIASIPSTLPPVLLGFGVEPPGPPLVVKMLVVPQTPLGAESPKRSLLMLGLAVIVVPRVKLASLLNGSILRL